MRKEYRKAVREAFASGLRSDLPAFEPVKIKAQILFGGESVFQWAACDHMHCFIILAPDAKGRQSFTVEVAWSTQGRFPDVTARPTLVISPGDPDPTNIDEGIIRLGDLANRSDKWWDLPDPALERPGDINALKESLEPMEASVAQADAAAPVKAAISMLQASAMEFFETLARLHCDQAGSPRVDR